MALKTILFYPSVCLLFIHVFPYILMYSTELCLKLWNFGTTDGIRKYGSGSMHS
jgi:hypothetical protein